MIEFELRPLTKHDIDDFVEHANNIKIARYMTDGFPHPYTRQDGEQFLEFVQADNGPEIRGICIDGKVVGAIGLHAQQDIHHRNMELGYWLAEPFWGKGIITKAVKQMVELGFKLFDIDRIFAKPFGTNIGSQKVLEKCGFELEARFDKTILKFGEYEDELIYGIRK